MVDYNNPLDRSYWEIPDIPEQKLSEPIIPISELGLTIVEKNPATGGNIIQNVQSAIRSGASVGQIVFNVSSQQAIGGRAKAYGKEVREALKELLHANKFVVKGIEMPTSSMSNMSGFNPQQMSFSSEKLHADMQEVKDAMKFAADVMGGGGVDIWSQEFHRTIFDQDYATKKDKEGKVEQVFWAHENEDKQGLKLVVDDRTGERITHLTMNLKHKVPTWLTADHDDPSKGVEEGDYVNDEGNLVSFHKRVAKTDKYGRIELSEGKKSLEEYKDRVVKFVDDDGNVTEKMVRREEQFYNDFAQAQINQSMGVVTRYNAEGEQMFDQYKEIQDQIKDVKEKLAKGESITKEDIAEVSTDLALRWDSLDEEKRNEIAKNQTEQMDKHSERLKSQAEGYLQSAVGSQQQADELKERLSHATSATDYGKKQSFNSYAELGLHAMNETNNNKDVTKDLYVGPELGWPGQFGGHPDEFIELVNESREAMVAKLTRPTDEQGNLNPFYNPQLSMNDAKDKAKRHIKGLFDTSHMGMWLNNFTKRPAETDAQHLTRFNEWYEDKVDELIASGTVGSIQAVDSASGAHGHLPPGQGIFPIAKTIQKFKESGFEGFIVSEGHEEEGFGHNRILTKMWEEVGAPLVTTSYPMGAVGGRGGAYGVPWGSVSGGYFGRTYTPFFIVGAYTPSNEWKLWSEVPLE